jgi:hypothetical protein
MVHPEDRLALIEVLDRDGRVRRSVDLHRWPVTLGRALDNTVVLDDPHVAARHATLAPDAAGQLGVHVGDSVNGVLLTPAAGSGTAQSLAAGASATLPATGALLQLGSQRLRLRLPGEALDDEHVFTRPVVAAGPALLGLAAAWFTLQAGLRWLDMDPGADFTQWLPWLLGLPLGLALWCGLWALASKLFRHGFDFIGHATVALPILLAMEAIDLALPALAASLGLPLLWQLHKLLAPPLLVAWLLRAHLRQLLPQRGRSIDITLAVLVVAGLGVGVALNQRQQGRMFADPYMRTLPLPMLRLDRPLPSAQIGEAMAPLRDTLAERVRQAAEDQPEDGDSPR